MINLGLIKSRFYDVRDHKPNMSMISGFLNPWDPLCIQYNIPKYFKRIRKYGYNFEEYYFTKLQISKIGNFRNFGTDLEKTGAEDDEDRF